MTTPDARDLLIVGRLRRAHGVAGDIIVEAITGAPATLFVVGRRLFAGTVAGDPDPDGASLHITRAEARFDGSWLLAFAELSTREAAVAWRLRYLLAPRAELDPPAEGEVYYHELVGMRVTLENGATLGDVRDVFDLPAGLALDVSWQGGSVLLPYLFVRTVDRGARLITAAPPEGLFA